ncbi:type II toxin-antitoxin system RelE/ParE family toxin [Burkholderia sp. Bp9017]|uniref:type II toxin-antitoxin system RelE/ParE family toxin n=1 Tax=Burkholderia TaxID=32008 RepID=UPI000F5F12B7|nr:MULTISPECIES: type II toxin-antitoxin system RelE/ParE family toxin [Burkholderia]MBY4869255.1 type II toxin-antitoxin system RelE/ParE family toxin [Burkholderia anthina]RQZ16287.1 type II toxin-antitoxin system RelE/ParE family toxin [Burkholderia sp. Bp9017]
MTTRRTVKFTANFEHNLEEIDAFLLEADTPQAFDALLDELTDTVIPNLERFPGMGREFLDRPARSVEAANGIARLATQLDAIGAGSELREYVTTHYLLLYALIEDTVHLLSIRHQRQLSFDLASHWPT